MSKLSTLALLVLLLASYNTRIEATDKAISHIVIAQLIPPTCQSILDYEASIRHDLVEHAALFTQDCKLVWEVAGNFDNVNVPDGNWTGMIETHNHTNETTLHTDDVVMVAARYHLHQERATRPGGDVCTLTETPGHPIIYVEFPYSDYLPPNFSPEAEDPVVLNAAYDGLLRWYANRTGTLYACY